jgi:chorismate--pyruvate lyase
MQFTRKKPMKAVKEKAWVSKPLAHTPLKKWLIDHDSLTKVLKSHYDDFNVQIVSVRHARPHSDELKALNINLQHLAFVREVLLVGAGKPVIFAHSVMSFKCLRGSWAKFITLGQKPLGETLFADPKINRTVMEFCHLTNQHPLYLKAAQASAKSGFILKDNRLWARRSIFNLCEHQQEDAKQIMVTEVFLPTLNDQ